MQKKIISVVVPVTRINYIGDLLDAISRQSIAVDLFEVILVSAADIRLDNSNYGFDIRIVKPEEKLSPSAARNLGVNEASSEFIVFTDDDCLPSSDWLSEWCAFINSQNVFVAAGCVLPWDISRLIQRFCLFKGIVSLKDESDFQGFVVTANCCFNKRVFNELLGFDKRFSFAGGEDVDISLRAKASGYVIDFCSKTLVYHRHSSSMFYWLKKYFYYGKAMHAVFALNSNASVLFEKNNYTFIKIFSLFKIPFKIVKSLQVRKKTGARLGDVLIFPFLSYFFNVVFNLGMLCGSWDKDE